VGASLLAMAVSQATVMLDVTMPSLASQLLQEVGMHAQSVSNRETCGSWLASEGVCTFDICAG